MCLRFSELLAGLCGSVVARQRDQDTKGAGSRSGLGPGLQFIFFLIDAL